MIPAALDEAARRFSAKAVYLRADHPQSDGGDRRSSAPRAARGHDPQARPAAVRGRQLTAASIRKLAPIATLIPERGYYAASLSKYIAPGLRVSLVLGPDRAAAASLAGALRTLVQMPVPMMAALALRWLGDGSADDIIAAVGAEAAAEKLAAKALSDHSYRAHPKGHHLWLVLPDSWTRAEFAAHIRRQGLAVVTSDSFAVDGQPEHAIRIALGAARTRADLVSALDDLVSH